MSQRSESRLQTNTRTAQLARLIAEIGPDIPEISRRLRQVNESVRYRYKAKILRKGFAVQSVVDHEKLGLQRIIVVADFAGEYVPHVRSIAVALNQLCYLVNYAKTIPDGHFILHASVPREHVRDFVDLMWNLKSEGVLKSVDSSVFDWFRNVPMRTEYFDFNSGRWDFEWPSLSIRGREGEVYQASRKQIFDYVDLLILKELQLDASRSLTEIAQKLKVNYNKLEWHYVTHVTKRGLMKGYRINWMGTRYDTKLEKALHRRHRYLFVNLFVRGATEPQKLCLMTEMQKLPFLWAEAAGRGNYYAQVALPLDFLTEGLQFIQRVIEPLKDDAKFYFEDTADALAFTFSYQLYDQGSKKWMFDPARLLAGFDKLPVKIGEGTG